MPNPLMQYLAQAHWHPVTQGAVTEPISNLAHAMSLVVPESAEKTAGLRKLLEAKDCFERAFTTTLKIIEPQPSVTATTSASLLDSLRNPPAN